MATDTEEVTEPSRVLGDRFSEAREILREHWFSYALFVPTLLLLVFVVWFPMLRGVFMAFHQWPFVGEPTWVGLENFEYIFGWEVFYTSFRATVIYSTVTFIQLGVALIAALLVARMEAFKNLVSALFLVPYTMPPVVTGTLWAFLLNPSTGPGMGYLTQMGILQEPIYWTNDGGAALGVIMFAISWTFWPFMFLVILATLESLPEEHYETAKIYGAGRVQTFWHITLPQIKSAILVAISIRMVWNLTKVSQPLQLTQGGPGYDTSILAILMYRFAWESGELGQGFSVGLVLLAVTLAFVLMFIREFERESASGGEL